MNTCPRFAVPMECWGKPIGRWLWSDDCGLLFFSDIDVGGRQLFLQVTNTHEAVIHGVEGVGLFEDVGGQHATPEDAANCAMGYLREWTRRRNCST
jgi:hypothetical protein